MHIADGRPRPDVACRCRHETLPPDPETRLQLGPVEA
jgi:hypothetical protein